MKEFVKLRHSNVYKKLSGKQSQRFFPKAVTVAKVLPPPKIVEHREQSLTLLLEGGGRLRLPRLSDAPEIFELFENNRAEFARWFSWLDQMKTVADAESYIRFLLDGNSGGHFSAFFIEIERCIAGFICFYSIDKAHRRAEIGYWLGRVWQKQGVMTKACRTLIDYGFNKLDLYRVQISCGFGNDASRAIPERLGFSCEGIARAREWVSKQPLDHFIYGLLQPEWQAVR